MRAIQEQPQSPIDRMPAEMLPEQQIRDIVERALAEDIGPGDVTTAAIVHRGAHAAAVLRTREPGIICGLDVARTVFAVADPDLRWEALSTDGMHALADQTLARVEGAVSAILTAERVALNLLQRMGGIATTTGAFVGAVSHTRARIVDTRKTAPGLRLVDKYAVRCGGGHNHRFGLFDGVLVKDNHIAAAGGITAALERVRERVPHTLRIEVEVDEIGQIEEALRAGADVILLDNMAPEMLREAVTLIAGRAETEASGGVSLETVSAIAEAGVDYISVGALTHSVRALDIGLDMERAT